ncbi:Uu.00g125780.m01.CDS01 [Anthostomella pinea]|uniref:Uu.00g125780.m01.CDS01 n=1 Tax=Anthostomella pinea TaxID=933095 RepID=A0AAI8VIW6_9PEZI|nr:Uu.00g125780.m01.CDS01 [Anthostomella pinea]
MFHLTVFIQLFLAALAFAAPIVDETVTASGGAAPWQYGTGGGILGFIVLVLDIIVWIEVLKSNRPVSPKLLWCVLVFLFPVVGIVVYWLFSNREAHNSGGYEPIS